MPELEIIPHPDEQRSYAELRAEFRAAALSNIRSQFGGRHPLGWDMAGNPEYARDRYTASEWCYQMCRHLDEAIEQNFGLDLVPDSLWSKLCKLAKESLHHESATWNDSTEGVIDHDAPACSDVGAMTDNQISDYVESSIRESERG